MVELLRMAEQFMTEYIKTAGPCVVPTSCFHQPGSGSSQHSA